MRIAVCLVLAALVAGAIGCGSDGSSPASTASPTPRASATPPATALPQTATAPPTATVTAPATLPAATSTPVAVASGEYAYVTNEESGTVSVIDTATNTLVDTLPAGIGYDIAALAAANDDTLVVRSRGRLAVVDTGTDRVRLSADVPGSGGVAIAAGGSRAYVGSGGTILAIDLGTGAVVASIVAGADVGALALDHRAETLYASTTDGIRRIDVASGVTENVIIARATAFAISPDDQLVYAIDGGTLLTFDRAMSAVTSRLLYNGALGRPAFSPDGRVAYVPLVGWGYFVIDTATRQILERVSMGAIGTTFVLTPDGRCAFSTLYGTVLMIDLVAQEEIAHIQAPIDNFLTDLVSLDEGRVLYVAPCRRGVCRVDTAIGQVSQPILSIGGLRRIAASRNGERAVVTTAAGPPVVLELPRRDSRVLLGGSFTEFPPESDGVALKADGSTAYVAHGPDFGSGRLSTVDLATLAETAIQTFETPVDDLALSPDERLAYVSSSQGAKVFAFDPVANQVTAAIDVDGGPGDIAFAPDGAKAYVVRTQTADVAVIDTAANAVAETIAFPISGFDPRAAVFDSPRGRLYALRGNDVVWFDLHAGATTRLTSLDDAGSGLALSPDGSTLYVISGYLYSYQGEIYVIDVASGVVTNEIHLFDGAPVRVAVTPDGTRIVVSVTPRFESNHGGMRIVDTATQALSGFIDLGRSNPDGVWITADSTRAFVAGCGRGTCIVDLDTHSVTADRLAWFARDIAFSPAANRGYALPYSPQSILEIDSTTGATLSTIDLERSASSLLLSADGSVLYADLGDRLVLIDTASGLVMRTIDHVPGEAVAIGAGADPSEIALLGAPPAAITVIDLTSGARSAFFPSSFTPAAIAVSPDGGSAYVTGHGDGGLIWPIALDRNEVEPVIVAGSEPAGAAFSSDGGTLYVADSAADSVLAIDARRNEVVAEIPVGRRPRAVAVVRVPSPLPTPEASATTTAATPTPSTTRIRRTRTPTRTRSAFIPTPTRTQTPLCGAICDGRACGFVLCPDGITFSPATCSSTLGDTCGCVPIACATPTQTATPTFPQPPAETCGPARIPFRGALCGAGAGTCAVISDEALPQVAGGVGGFALDTNDVPHLLYTSNVSGAHPTYVTRLGDGAWTTDEAPFAGFTGSLALGPDGVGYTLMRNFADNQQTLWSHAEGAWRMLGDVPPGAQIDPALVLDGAGCLHSGANLYEPATDGYARWEGGWRLGAVGAVGEGGFKRALALSPRGRPYLLYRSLGNEAGGYRFAPVPGPSEPVPIHGDGYDRGLGLAVTQDGEGVEVAHATADSLSFELSEQGSFYQENALYARRAPDGTWSLTTLASGTRRSSEPCPEPPQYPTGQTCVEEYVSVAPTGMVSNGADVWILLSRQMFRQERPLRCYGAICMWDYTVPIHTGGELVLLAPGAAGFEPALVLRDLDGGPALVDSRGRIHLLAWGLDGIGHHLQIGIAPAPG